MPIRSTFSFAALAFVGLAAHAQGQAPGLWESTMTMKTADGRMEKGLAEMQKRLAALPPDQRAQAEAAMARSGVKFGANGTTMQICISKEQAARHEPHMPGNCTTSDYERSASSMKFKFVCTGARPSSGAGEWTFSGDKSYTGHMSSTTTVAGKPEQMTIETSGRWLSADCGDVKPTPMLNGK